MSINSEYVKALYSLLLDRDVESLDMMRELSNLNSIKHLRTMILCSPEFKQKNPTVISNYFLDNLLVNAPKMDVESNPENIDVLFNHIQNVWKTLGETEPHWSVLSAPDFKQKSIEKNKKIFYESGAGDINLLKNTLSRNGLSIDDYSSCLEYGCGLGRVTFYLASEFEKVYGCDISKSHLNAAYHYLTEQNIKNVEFLYIESLESLQSLPQVDLIFTLIVLQHNPPPLIAKIIEIFMQKLKPNGVALFQLPIYRKGY
jgi:2-polyprenyl-3-methyl-5-hydroxy-6-metoxy-1,4-benzoquinol methylase